MEDNKCGTLAEYLEKSGISRQDLRDMIEHTTFALATMAAREFENVPDEVVQVFSLQSFFMEIANDVL